MKPRQATWMRHRRLTAAGAVLTTTLLTVGLVNPAARLQQDFDAAIRHSAETLDIANSSHGVVPTPVAGSEAYWLGSSPTETRTAVQPVAWQTPVAKGDRFAISAGSRIRKFEVVDVQSLAATGSDLVAHESESRTAKPTYFLVTCRTTDKGPAETLKFIVDADSSLPWTPANPAARSL